MYSTTGKHQFHSLRNADRVFVELRFYTNCVTLADSRFLSILTIFVLKLHHELNIYWGYPSGIGFLILALFSRLYFICPVTIQGSG